MSVKISGVYLGNKKVELIHAPSQASIITDAPKDNFGDGSCFSPTDLFAASLGTCIVTTMAIFADRNGIDMNGAKFELEKHMLSDPRRVGSLPITVHLPTDLNKENRIKLERVAHTCPVHKSLHPDIKVEIKFIYDLV